MGTYIHYTDEQKERANTVDLVELLWQSGERPQHYCPGQRVV